MQAPSTQVDQPNAQPVGQERHHVARPSMRSARVRPLLPPPGFLETSHIPILPTAMEDADPDEDAEHAAMMMMMLTAANNQLLSESEKSAGKHTRLCPNASACIKMLCSKTHAPCHELLPCTG